MRTRRLIWVLALLSLPVVGAEQGSEQPHRDRVRVVSVQVPVQVTLAREPLRGLTADNFALYDEGKPQTIDGFDVVDLSLIGTDDAAPWLPQLQIAGRRHFLIVFDVSFSEPSSIHRARQAVRDWIATALHPADLVAVAKYSFDVGPQLILNFTSDREQAALAVDSLGAPQLVDRTDDPLGLEIGLPRFASLEHNESFAQLDGSPVQDEEDDVRSAMLEVFYGAYEPLLNQARRHDIATFSQNFAQLAKLMRSVKGRKYVVYLSEGFENSLVFSSNDRSEVEMMNQALESGAYWRVDSNKRYGSQAMQAYLMSMLEEFRRADCVIHAIDIRGNRGSADQRVMAATDEGLYLMANETGGELHRNFENLAEAMDTLLERTSVTYLLSFTPAKLKDNGKYHKLKVKLNDVPSKARVAHRPGYYAPRPYSERTGAERQLTASQLIVEGREHGALLTSVLAAPFMGSEGAYVPVLIEIDGVALLADHRGEKLALEIYAYAFDSAGNLADFFTQTIGLQLEKVGGRLRHSGLKFFGELELPHGEYSLRVLVWNKSSGGFGVRSLQLGVPAFDGGRPAVLPPLFPEPRGKWLLARQVNRDGATSAQPFPFMIGREPYLPAAKPVIRHHSPALVFLPTYNLNGGAVSIDGRVMSMDGREVRRLDLPVLERTPTQRQELEILQTSISSEGLEAGDYQLVITVSDTEHGLSHSSSIVFSVAASG